MKNPIVTITMANGKKVKVELYPDVAPNTVNNFISLVNKGFYNGLKFHRVIRGFMIQGGAPRETAPAAPGTESRASSDKTDSTTNLRTNVA